MSWQDWNLISKEYCYFTQNTKLKLVYSTLKFLLLEFWINYGGTTSFMVTAKACQILPCSKNKCSKNRSETFIDSQLQSQISNYIERCGLLLLGKVPCHNSNRITLTWMICEHHQVMNTKHLPLVTGKARDWADWRSNNSLKIVKDNSSSFSAFLHWSPLTNCIHFKKKKKHLCMLTV